VKRILATLLFVACSSSAPAAGVTPHTLGALGDTWIRTGATWRQVIGPHPSPRYAASLAYDAARRAYVLFGGQNGSVSYDETWLFNGANWNQVLPAHRPPPRRGAAMAYDPQLKLVVLYGGVVPDRSEGSEASDTWTWDGIDWTEVSAGNDGPGPRDSPAMVTTGEGVILFGGHIGNTQYFGDAWNWDGKDWSRADHEPRPPGRGDPASGWNPSDSSLFVYGGLGLRPDSGPGNLGLALSDVWSLKNGTWSQLTGTGPPTTADGNAVWDQSAQSMVVMFGIVCPNPVADAWAYNGSVWAHSILPVPARWRAAVAEDSRDRVVVFGGNDQPGC